MSAPSAAVRTVTYERDGGQCVSCGRFDHLSYQHRQATGMGGSKRRPALADGVTSCAFCNPRYESALQGMALRFGWKVPRWVDDPTRVPIFYVGQRRWYRLTPNGGAREHISDREAVTAMREVYGEGWGLVRDEEAGPDASP